MPPNGQRVWLKGYGCVRHTRDAFEYTGDSIEAVREENVPVVHWVPADETVPLTLRTMDGAVTGHAEPGLREYSPDDVVQFERVGFARIEELNDHALAYFAHP